MKRLLKAYPVVAIIGFNFILLTVVSLWVLDGVLQLRHAISGKGQVIHSDSFDLSSFRMASPETAKEIAADHDDWGSSHPFSFNPWTTFMVAPFTSRHINIRRDDVLNFRLNRSTGDESGREGEGDIVVWAFGGSTLFGFGVSDDLTIPAFLEKHLRERFSGRTVRVVNFGQPYWYGSVEAAAYLALLRERRKPDATLFLDGLNDVSWGISGYTVPVFAARANKAWEHERRDEKRELPWFSVNESFPVTRLVRGLKYAAGGGETTPSDPYRRTGGRSADDVASTMLRNYAAIRSLSSAFGTKVFVFLQPTPWFGSYTAPVHAQFPFGDIASARAVYGKLIQASHAEMSGVLFDLSGVLRSVEKPFVDRVHYSDVANDLLASAISAVLAPSL